MSINLICGRCVSATVQFHQYYSCYSVKIFDHFENWFKLTFCFEIWNFMFMKLSDLIDMCDSQRLTNCWANIFGNNQFTVEQYTERKCQSSLWFVTLFFLLAIILLFYQICHQIIDQRKNSKKKTLANFNIFIFILDFCTLTTNSDNFLAFQMVCASYYVV